MEIIAPRTLHFLIKSSLDQQQSGCNEGIWNVYIDFLRKNILLIKQTLWLQTSGNHGNSMLSLMSFTRNLTGIPAPKQAFTNTVLLNMSPTLPVSLMFWGLNISTW